MSAIMPDPYGVVPDGFLDQWDVDTIDEGLAIMERKRSSTPYKEMKRCPNCGSTRVKNKQRGLQGIQAHTVLTDYKCDRCNTHFDHRLVPRCEFEPVSPVCPDCDSKLIDIEFRRLNVVCRDCGGEFDQAASSRGDSR